MKVRIVSGKGTMMTTTNHQQHLIFLHTTSNIIFGLRSKMRQFSSL